MAKEVFNRHEIKFLLDKVTYKNILDKLSAHLEVDDYNKEQEFYTISNIYYDTKDNHLIRNSLSKPKYKEKLRIRAYGIPKSDEKVYLEVKKKVCGLVNKRRTSLSLSEAYGFISTGIKPELKEYMNRQVIEEIAYILKIYDLEPKLYLAYDRKAFFSKDDKNLRITFDTNIRTRRYDLKLETGDFGEKLLDNNQYIMEIKTVNSIPIWLVNMLSEHKIYKTSFSKYGTEYKRMLLNNQKLKGEVKGCWNKYLAPLQLTPQYLL